MVRALLWLGYPWFYLYPPGLIPWHKGYRTYDYPNSSKLTLNDRGKKHMNQLGTDDVTSTKQSTTKPYTYLIGCTVYLLLGWEELGDLYHDDVIKWKYFPRYWPFVRGIHRSSVNSPHKDQWRIALIFSLICAWINGWANNREAGDLWRHHTHYDVIVMLN